MTTSFLHRLATAGVAILVQTSAPFAVASPLAPVDAGALIERSDRARGGHLPGVAWTIEIVSNDGDREAHQAMAAVTRSGDTRVDYTAPERMNGQFVIMLGRNMWFSSPGLRRPVPISPRQRLVGQAAMGDIASTNYRDDYSARFIREETWGGERCAVLDLTAKAKNVTYDRIRYWVSESRVVGTRRSSTPFRASSSRPPRLSTGIRSTTRDGALRSSAPCSSSMRSNRTAGPG
jgi:hypothetical protein